MKEIKRYDVDVDPQDGPVSLWDIEDGKGKYVYYDDHAAIVAALQAESDSNLKSAQYSAETNRKVVKNSIELHDTIAALQEQVRALAAENSIQDFIISAVKDLVRESEGVVGWHLNGDIATWDKVLPELNHSETPATNTAIREIRAQAMDDAAAEVDNWVGCDLLAQELRKKSARIRAGEQP